MCFEVAHANPRILRHYARVVGNSPSRGVAGG